MSESDWDTVTVLRKKAPKASSLKTESAVNQARRQGLAVETSQKCKLSRAKGGFPILIYFTTTRFTRKVAIASAFAIFQYCMGTASTEMVPVV